MKILQLLIICFSFAVLCACNDAKVEDNGNQAAKTETKAKVPHDHDGDGVPDHGPGAHGKKEHVPHDHDGDGIPDHGPGEHGKSNNTQQGKSMTQNEADELNERMKAKAKEAEKREPNAAEKATGNKICECLQKLSIFQRIKDAKDQESFNKAAEKSNVEEVKAMQKCHVNFMKPAIGKFTDPVERAVHGFKTREAINKTCFDGNADLWLFMGQFVSDRTGPKE